jgi:hypothetical protein
VELVGGIVFFGALLVLLAMAIWSGMHPHRKEPTAVVPLPATAVVPLSQGEVRVYVQPDGWAEWERSVDGKVVAVEEAAIWDEEAIGILVGFGLSSDEARAQLALVDEAAKGVLSKRGTRLRDSARRP